MPPTRRLRDWSRTWNTGAPTPGRSPTGPRYAKLSGAVVAFRALVTATHIKFKLGQDERSDVRSDILAGLAGTGQGPLLEAMTRENGL